jgi:hypothetical protein
VVAEILERALHPRVPPRRILLRHPPYQLADFGEDTTTACSCRCVRPLAGDELPVPAEQRVGRDDRRHVAQCLPAHSVGARGESPPVLVGEPQAPSTHLPPQYPIFFD